MALPAGVDGCCDSWSSRLLEGTPLRVPTYASDRLVTMNNAARMAVARDSAVLAPRAPNTVPEAPAPKPAPASAPLPRCSSTSPTMEKAQIK